MPKLDLETFPLSNATGYPAAYAGAVAERWFRRLGPLSGITDFGVSHVTLKPGAWSGHRHWHEGEDEFLVMLSGKAVLIDDDGRTPLGPGDCVAYPKNDGNGHHVVNDSGDDCVFVVVGKPLTTDCHYPDVDMHYDGTTGRQRHKDGRPY